MSTILKFSFENQIRRLTVNQTLNYDALCALIRTLYRPVLDDNDFIIKYIDLEGDEIICGSDLELAEAMTQTKHGVLRVTLEKKKLKQEKRGTHHQLWKAGSSKS